ncbi:unnamed protein product [Vitrella brassicaformis CCMP3155]|uniref:Pentraxin (PTX) domain-containing protein n=2 Tax=Vitrella brassicaformis TaxID=1169539 RepID=A0A0G4FGW5_VITBC|nr:unnamed protein product [Vitrella brassicaformis CCMP3155]|mmetsp:Transcript_35553/g.88369  ORF Transcript_35553/g.88369 Transcript_35553/m.88369 type:complete len:691 (+) Transcript_35553:138-2210(+)|eukprot:CEM12645.1 unnamed protein product [Vitrella brassicaformis CCMP3155]
MPTLRLRRPLAAASLLLLALSAGPSRAQQSCGTDTGGKCPGAKGEDFPGYTTVWRDDFEGDELDSDRWTLTPIVKGGGTMTDMAKAARGEKVPHLDCSQAGSADAVLKRHKSALTVGCPLASDEAEDKPATQVAAEVDNGVLKFVPEGREEDSVQVAIMAEGTQGVRMSSTKPILGFGHLELRMKLAKSANATLFQSIWASPYPSSMDRFDKGEGKGKGKGKDSTKPEKLDGDQYEIGVLMATTGDGKNATDGKMRYKILKWERGSAADKSPMIANSRLFTAGELRAFNGDSSQEADEDFMTIGIDYSPLGIRLSLNHQLYGETLFAAPISSPTKPRNQGYEVIPAAGATDSEHDGRPIPPELPPVLYLHIDVLPLAQITDAAENDTGAAMMIDSVRFLEAEKGLVYKFPSPPSLTSRIETRQTCSLSLGFPQLTQFTFSAWLNIIPLSQHPTPTEAVQPFLGYGIPGQPGRQLEMLIRAVGRDLEVSVADQIFLFHNFFPDEKNWCARGGCWKHLTVSWQSSTGRTSVYLNGDKMATTIIAMGEKVRRFGILTIGHSTEYRFNGRIYPHKTMIGEMAQIKLFSYLLDDTKIAGLVSCDNIFGDLIDSSIPDTLLHYGDISTRAVDTEKTEGICSVPPLDDDEKGYVEGFLGEVWVEGRNQGEKTDDGKGEVLEVTALSHEEGKGKGKNR